MKPPVIWLAKLLITWENMLFSPYSLKGERIGVLCIIISYTCSGDKTIWKKNDLFKVLECVCSSITSLWFSISDVSEWKTEYRTTSNQKLLMFFGLLPHEHLTLTRRAGRGSMSVLMGTEQSRSNGYHLGIQVSLEHFQHNTQSWRPKQNTSSLKVCPPISAQSWEKLRPACDCVCFGGELSQL